MKTYTLKKFMHTFGKSILVIIIFALIGGVAMGLDAKHKKTTTYTATRSIVISHNIEKAYQSKQNNSQDSLVNEDANMMPTYKEIAENGTIATAAHHRLSKHLRSKYSSSDVKSAVKAKVTPQSLVMDLKAETKSPKDSVAIVNATAQAMKQELPTLQPGSGKVTLLQKANTDEVSSSSHPSIKKHAAVGLALGGLLGMIVSFIAVTIKNFLVK
ncbi:chain-length determining protein [Limosilactobacillus sp.]|uniref:chain-length determining protein n=1 Tax=Limosilactobacillus sp. TaxID=2773925 RepID=UPI0025C2DAD3|nr:chain-length determining protein [Limosilactobacillus sp.]MCH3923214.1 chain-length determining protein [Limosilactobacillus sp.]MCH3927896.1 chain-length determining protein [Limosilactobacillus sp.]